MAIVKSDPIEGLLENITVYEYADNSSVVMRELRAHEGYVIYDITEDRGTDEEGNDIPPIYTYSAYLPSSYPITNYAAILITPGMEVVGKRDELEEEII